MCTGTGLSFGTFFEESDGTFLSCIEFTNGCLGFILCYFMNKLPISSAPVRAELKPFPSLPLVVAAYGNIVNEGAV